jgi:hypothetical protein
MGTSDYEITLSLHKRQEGNLMKGKFCFSCLSLSVIFVVTCDYDKLIHNAQLFL